MRYQWFQERRLGNHLDRQFIPVITDKHRIRRCLDPDLDFSDVGKCATAILLDGGTEFLDPVVAEFPTVFRCVLCF